MGRRFDTEAYLLSRESADNGMPCVAGARCVTPAVVMTVARSCLLAAVSHVVVQQSIAIFHRDYVPHRVHQAFELLRGDYKHLLRKQKVLNNALYQDGMPESSWTVALPVCVLVNHRHHIRVQRAR